MGFVTIAAVVGLIRYALLPGNKNRPAVPDQTLRPGVAKADIQPSSAPSEWKVFDHPSGLVSTAFPGTPSMKPLLGPQAPHALFSVTPDCSVEVYASPLDPNQTDLLLRGVSTPEQILDGLVNEIHQTISAKLPTGRPLKSPLNHQGFSGMTWAFDHEQAAIRGHTFLVRNNLISVQLSSVGSWKDHVEAGNLILASLKIQLPEGVEFQEEWDDACRVRRAVQFPHQAQPPEFLSPIIPAGDLSSMSRKKLMELASQAGPDSDGSAIIFWNMLRGSSDQLRRWAELDRSHYWVQRSIAEDGRPLSAAENDPVLQKFAQDCREFWKTNGHRAIYELLPKTNPQGIKALVVLLVPNNTHPRLILGSASFQTLVDRLNVGLVGVSGNEMLGPRAYRWSGAPASEKLEDRSQAIKPLRLIWAELAKKHGKPMITIVPQEAAFTFADVARYDATFQEHGQSTILVNVIGDKWFGEENLQSNDWKGKRFLFVSPFVHSEEIRSRSLIERKLQSLGIQSQYIEEPLLRTPEFEYTAEYVEQWIRISGGVDVMSE